MSSVQIFRYIFSGGISALITLCTLYLLHDLSNVHYLLASIAAYCLGVIISFTLQKRLTFQDNNNQKIGLQGFLYTTLLLFNLGVNIFIMYILVDLLHIWYLMSQVIAGGTIAISSFFAYKHIIFTPAIYEKSK